MVGIERVLKTNWAAAINGNRTKYYMISKMDWSSE